MMTDEQPDPYISLRECRRRHGLGRKVWTDAIRSGRLVGIILPGRGGFQARESAVREFLAALELERDASTTKGGGS